MLNSLPWTSVNSLRARVLFCHKKFFDIFRLRCFLEAIFHLYFSQSSARSIQMLIFQSHFIIHLSPHLHTLESLVSWQHCFVLLLLMFIQFSKKKSLKFWVEISSTLINMEEKLEFFTISFFSIPSSRNRILYRSVDYTYIQGGKKGSRKESSKESHFFSSSTSFHPVFHCCWITSERVFVRLQLSDDISPVNVEHRDLAVVHSFKSSSIKPQRKSKRERGEIYIISTEWSALDSHDNASTNESRKFILFFGTSSRTSTHLSSLSSSSILLKTV